MTQTSRRRSLRNRHENGNLASRWRNRAVCLNVTRWTPRAPAADCALPALRERRCQRLSRAGAFDRRESRQYARSRAGGLTSARRWFCAIHRSSAPATEARCQGSTHNRGTPRRLLLRVSAGPRAHLAFERYCFASPAVLCFFPERRVSAMRSVSPARRLFVAKPGQRACIEDYARTRLAGRLRVTAVRPPSTFRASVARPCPAMKTR